MNTPSARADSILTPRETSDRAASTADVRCTHCSLPVPPGLVVAGRREQFCCHGCESVYEIIHGCGLDRFYKLRAGENVAAPRALVTGRGYEEFDDPAFAARHVMIDADGLARLELYLEGVHCAACVWLVEKLPRVVPGVLEARLDFRRGLVRLRVDTGAVALSRVAAALDSLGYPPHPARDIASRALRRREDHRFLVRIGVAGACAGNVMMLSFALYGGFFAGIEAQFAVFFRWLSMLIGLLALAWPGSLFFRGAIAALRTHTAHMDLPIALGLAVGALGGVIHTILGHGEIYFDSLTALVFLLLVGRWIQQRQQRWAADAVELLYSLTPAAARVVAADGAVRSVPIEAVQRGDTVEIRAGETVPVDGDVIAGEATFDQSLLTGESRPVARRSGDVVCAGTVNLSASVRIAATATGADTRVGRLMTLVERSARERAPIIELADRLAGWFTVVVLVLAAFTLGLWLWLDPAHSIGHATALLIVACPCALGLATPLAVAVAIGRSAKRGILIKGGQTLERLARPGTILLDKTGTLTRGRQTLVQWTGDDDAKVLAAALERASAHPAAQALVAALPEPDAALVVRDVDQKLGGGISGTVGDHSVQLGTANYLEAANVAIDDALHAAANHAARDGLTPILVAVDGRAVALAALGDPLRDDAADVLARLRRAGWQVGILSGDHPATVAAIARQLGVDPHAARGGVSPEEKLAAVRAAQAADPNRPVVMVGDGVNDAAALSAATVGIAVHGGAEASLAAADVYLSRAGLAPIAALLSASGRTFRTIRTALAASLVYNAVGATLAITGVINPVIAAVLMPLSSFTVLALALGARTYDAADSEPGSTPAGPTLVPSAEAH